MDQQAEAYFKVLEKEVRYYRLHANKVMILFVVIRLVLTILSASLPAMAAMAGDAKWSALLTGASIAIAVLAALDTQFKWGDEWRQYRTTQMSIRRLMRLYREGAYAPGLKDDARYQKFVRDAEGLIARDSESFFKFRITEWRDNTTDGR